jgi:hypothetical protein
MSKRGKVKFKAKAQAAHAPVKQEAAAQEKVSAPPAAASAATGWQENQKVSFAIHGAGGLAAGVLSYFIGGEYGLLTGVILLFVILNVYKILSGKKKLGVWAAPLIFLYLFLWLDAWVFMYNFL